MFEVILSWILQLHPIVIGLAVLFQFLDAALGMGFGTLTPILLLLGFIPLEVVPSVILTTAVLGIISGGIHIIFKNVDFWYGVKNIKIASLFFGTGIVAILVGVFLAINIPEFALKLYVGGLTMLMGVLLIIDDAIRNMKKDYFTELKEYFEKIDKRLDLNVSEEEEDPHQISWLRLGGLASLASFNKGLTGGGYGPVLAAGQVLSGLDSKRAIGITVTVEGLVSAVGFVAYCFITETININWALSFSILIGGLIAAPISGLVVNKLNPNKLKYAIGVFSSLIGLLSILSTIFDFTISV